MNKQKQLEEFDQILKEWNSTELGRRAFMASLPILMASCATRSQHRHREGDNTGQATSMTVNDEKRMTQEVLPKMKKDYPAVKNTQMQNYIQSLGQKIVRANNLANNPYQYNFTAVNVNYVNAFALPAGEIMVTAPLIAMAGSEAELAGVIGHEIGHVKARHTAERMDAAKRAQRKSWMYAVGGGLLGGATGFGLGKLLCRKEDKKCLSKATAAGAGLGGMGGLLVQKYAFMQNSQEDELEADRIGFRTSVAAGYHKDHVGKFYEKLLLMEKKSQSSGKLMKSFADAMSTHPPSDQRVQQMNQMAQASKGKGRISSKTFERMQRLAKSLKA